MTKTKRGRGGEVSTVTRSRRAQRGLSIVELMVGVAIGLFIIGGAIKLFVDMFGNNRRLMIEARVNQDLRAAADIIARDIRRAGYWQGAASAMNVAPGAVPTPNPYAAATVITGNSVGYAYDRGAGASAAGFSLFNNAIYMTVGGASQPLTDPATVRITNFQIVNSASSAQASELWQHCACVGIASGAAGACPVNFSTSASRPQAVSLWVDIVIDGEAAAASAVRRQVIESVRVRNDQIVGACPP
jgi:prepilin peptidase dependent protein B